MVDKDRGLCGDKGMKGPKGVIGDRGLFVSRILIKFYYYKWRLICFLARFIPYFKDKR